MRCSFLYSSDSNILKLHYICAIDFTFAFTVEIEELHIKPAQAEELILRVPHEIESMIFSNIV